MTGLLWLILLTIVVVSCFVVSKCSYRFEEPIFIVARWLSAIALFIMLLAWPIAWYGNKTFGERHRATQETIDAVREMDYDTTIERAVLIHTAIGINQRLAVRQYWNDGLWDWYIPDDVANLELLR